MSVEIRSAALTMGTATAGRAMRKTTLLSCRPGATPQPDLYVSDSGRDERRAKRHVDPRWKVSEDIILSLFEADCLEG
jgi:hypothetical protein